MFVSFPPSSKTDALANFFYDIIEGIKLHIDHLPLKMAALKKTAPYN